MKQHLRHKAILERLEAQEYLSVEGAVALCGASPATVRRDFNALARRGLGERTHGGLRRPSESGSGELPYTFREVQYSEEKAALARAAVGLLRAREVITVDGGTTTFHLAGCLPDFPLSVITNSVRLATALGERRLEQGTVEICLTGGYLFPELGLLAGPPTIASLGQYHAQWAFLSASGICTEGVYNPNAFIVESERVMIANADRVVILGDHSKIGRRSMCRVCGWDEVDVLITTAYPGQEATLSRIQEAGVEVVEVRVGAAEAGMG